ncbi:K+-transporting ATPase ATPase C chain [Streptoalloteichus tenebrarius]|uniref:Potassium-transporting ATPase KdpC subunit n=1 Tax=Streptoalloteichus tenebrarius (strain ATCC 17920 / DSM 40477 / JCM 4838 / CBS 697.72 / NBRC 16177 / NCIMB 11028 / NRRL B-12390 / A12253. 1 / ISP 5477) TaxID=1933 RepID=A0ABT1HZE6_STRSD|nr:potassium-transporting ATPase subunit C [Streptoalloteichus tenebrarius]MCP2260902.1 K+-transporting ATPase ATPase C chain [Streptoalloteichus tenebrarius]BFF03337.1 potassium-transporting ATPase subunit C [Streptoalloteichus tenebrarius]
MKSLTNLLRQTAAGLRVLLVMTVLLGVLYPLAVWGVTRLPGLRDNAEGSIVRVNDTAAGSELIGVDPVDPRAKDDPTADRWFHTRPSATVPPADGQSQLGPDDVLPSGGSNKAGDNDDLRKAVEERRAAVAARERVDPARVPADAVTASASGLDPHISRDYAELQAPRVARENGIPEQRVRDLVAEHTQGRPLGVLGEPGVNVTTLNLAVQREAGR